MRSIKTFINEVLTKGRLLSLATVDSGGPWVSDVLFVHDKNFCLYWISRKYRRHSEALRGNPKVAASITIIPSPTGKDFGVQLEGTAEELPDVPKIEKAYWKKRGDGPKLPITSEHAWYKLTLTKIELIHESLFGHEKKVFIP